MQCTKLSRHNGGSVSLQIFIYIISINARAYVVNHRIIKPNEFSKPPGNPLLVKRPRLCIQNNNFRTDLKRNLREE